MITQTTLQTILETIFPGVNVVPKQGNWWNPQNGLDKTTFIAYLIRNTSPTATAFMLMSHPSGYNR